MALRRAPVLLLAALLLPACAARVRRPVFVPATGQAVLTDPGGRPLARLQASVLTATVPVDPGADPGVIEVAVRIRNQAEEALEVRAEGFRLLTADLRPLPAARAEEGPESRSLAPGEEERWVLAFPAPPPAPGDQPPDVRGLVLEWEVRDAGGRVTQGSLSFTARPRRPHAWPSTWVAWPPGPWYPWGYPAWPPYGWCW